MVRHKLVRQCAMNFSSDSTMPSPQRVRRRRNSQDSAMFRELSSESLENLLGTSGSSIERKSGGRRHSVACGVLSVELQGSAFKSALNTAVKKVSSACSILSSAPSTTFNLSPPPRKEKEVILPNVLGTFRKDRMPIPPHCTFKTKNYYHSNRRFSSDCPPPGYSEALKQPAMINRQKLTRQQEFMSKSSLGSVGDDDDLEDRLIK